MASHVACWSWDSICLPKKLLRDAFPAQKTICFAQTAPAGRFTCSKYNPYTLRAARRPCLYALAMPAPPPITRVATLSSLLTGTMGPKGIKWDPRGDPRAPSAPFGGMGPGGPLGLFRSHSEWKAISNGKQLRMEGHSEIKAIS